MSGVRLSTGDGDLDCARVRAFLVGDGFTLVDVHLAGAAVWIGGLGFDLKTWPRLEAWAKRCQDRPAFSAAMKG